MKTLHCRHGIAPRPFGLVARRSASAAWPNSISVTICIRSRYQPEAAAMLVLRVGNSPFMLGSAQEALQRHGISGECAMSGCEALDFLRLYDYDIVLMDLQQS